MISVLDPEQLIPLGLSVNAGVVQWMAGNRKTIAWKIGLAGQGLWFWFIWEFNAWGLLPLSVMLAVVYTRNMLRWAKEDRELKQQRQEEHHMKKIRQIIIELPPSVESDDLMSQVADLAYDWEKENHADRTGWDVTVSTTTVEVDDLDYPYDDDDDEDEPDDEITYAVGEDPPLGERVKEFFSWHVKNNTRTPSQPEGTAHND